MNYIKCSIDLEGLCNNGLHVYLDKVDITKDGDTKRQLLPVDNASFIITDTPLNVVQQLDATKTIDASKDNTPKQLHNIIFFEILKAFRR